jgi:integrase
LLQAEDRTIAYTNQYLARIKAFINWCVPDRLLSNPLLKLKRGNAKKGIKRRARRPLAEHELTKLLTKCPKSRRLKYAFPAFTGLRRKELEQVLWGDLHLDSVIPYIQLRPEQTKMG